MGNNVELGHIKKKLISESFKIQQFFLDDIVFHNRPYYFFISRHLRYKKTSSYIIAFLKLYTLTVYI